MRLTTQTRIGLRAHDGRMKENLTLPRRTIAPKPRVELRGPRRTRPARRHGLRTRCGYLLFTSFV
jgi:hypothetical protein